MGGESVRRMIKAKVEPPVEVKFDGVVMRTNEVSVKIPSRGGHSNKVLF